MKFRFNWSSSILPGNHTRRLNVQEAFMVGSKDVLYRKNGFRKPLNARMEYAPQG